MIASRVSREAGLAVMLGRSSRKRKHGNLRLQPAIGARNAQTSSVASSWIVLYVGIVTAPYIGGCQAPTNARNDQAPMPMLAIWRERARSADAEVLLAVWESGAIVFSDEAHTTTMRRAEVDKKKIVECVNTIRTAGFFHFPPSNSRHFGPDSDYVVVAGRDGANLQILASWHELWSANERVVVTDAGIVFLEGRSKEDYRLDPESPYGQFRSLWDTAKSNMLALVPDNSAPFHDKGGEIVKQLRRMMKDR